MKYRSALSLAVILLAASGAFAFQQSSVPRAPINLAVNGDYQGAVAVAHLTWQDESQDETGFEILRSDNNGEFRVVGMVGSNTVRYDDKVGKYITGAFAYKVRAFNQSGKSEPSNQASVWF